MFIGWHGNECSLTRWFRDNFAADLVAQEESGGAPAYAELVKEAKATPPGAEV